MEAETETNLPSLRELLFEAVLAVATLTLWPILDERSQGTSAERSRAMVFFPIVGFILGVVLAIFDSAIGVALGPVARSLATLMAAAGLSLGLANRGLADTVEVLRRGMRPASTGLTRIGPLGAIASIAAFAFEVWCLARIADNSGRAAAIVMADRADRLWPEAAGTLGTRGAIRRRNFISRVRSLERGRARTHDGALSKCRTRGDRRARAHSAGDSADTKRQDEGRVRLRTRGRMRASRNRNLRGTCRTRHLTTPPNRIRPHALQNLAQRVKRSIVIDHEARMLGAFIVGKLCTDARLGLRG